MPAIGLGNIFANNRIITATTAANKLQPQRRIIFLIDFDAFYLLELFDAALYLHGFGCLVTETLDELFCILYLPLLVS